jgi:hypothetical protein
VGGGALDRPALEDQHPCVRERFRRVPVDVALLEAEQAAGQVEAGDLAPAVAQNLVGPHRPLDDAVDELGILALAVDLFLAGVGEGRAEKVGAIGEEAGSIAGSMAGSMAVSVDALQRRARTRGGQGGSRCRLGAHRFAPHPSQGSESGRSVAPTIFRALS